MTAGVSAPASYLGDDLVTGEAVAVEMPVASLPARIGAALIDLVVLYVLATGSTVGLAFVIGSSSAAVGTTLTLLFGVDYQRIRFGQIQSSRTGTPLSSPLVSSSLVTGGRR